MCSLKRKRDDTHNNMSAASMSETRDRQSQVNIDHGECSNTSCVFENIVGSEAHLACTRSDKNQPWLLYQCKNAALLGRHNEVFEFIAKNMSPSPTTLEFVFNYIFEDTNTGTIRKISSTDAKRKWCQSTLPLEFPRHSNWIRRDAFKVIYPNLDLFVDGNNDHDRAAALLATLMHNKTRGYSYLGHMNKVDWHIVQQNVRIKALCALMRVIPDAKNEDLCGLYYINSSDVLALHRILLRLDVYVDVLEAFNDDPRVMSALEEQTQQFIRQDTPKYYTPWVEPPKCKTSTAHLQTYSRWNRWIPTHFDAPVTKETKAHNKTCAEMRTQELMRNTSLDRDTISIIVDY